MSMFHKSGEGQSQGTGDVVASPWSPLSPPWWWSDVTTVLGLFVGWWLSDVTAVLGLFVGWWLSDVTAVLGLFVGWWLSDVTAVLGLFVGWWLSDVTAVLGLFVGWWLSDVTAVLGLFVGWWLSDVTAVLGLFVGWWLSDVTAVLGLFVGWLVVPASLLSVTHMSEHIRPWDIHHGWDSNLDLQLLCECDTCQSRSGPNIHYVLECGTHTIVRADPALTYTVYQHVARVLTPSGLICLMSLSFVECSALIKPQQNQFTMTFSFKSQQWQCSCSYQQDGISSVYLHRYWLPWKDIYNKHKLAQHCRLS